MCLSRTKEICHNSSGVAPARDYGSTMGRWLSPDPLAGDTTNPQSLNRYAYALNNPTSLIDRLGLDPNNCAIRNGCREPSANGCTIANGCRDPGMNLGGFGGSCYIDGIASSCVVAQDLLNADAAAACPNNFCSGFAPVGNGQIAFVQFNASLGAYDVINQPFYPGLSPEQYLDALNAQLAYVIAGLEEQGATKDQIDAFIHANFGQRVINPDVLVEGGNFHFGNLYAPDSENTGQIFDYSTTCANSRSDNGLDFSHAGGDNFHRDTTNPYFGLPYAIVHLAVDVIAGNWLAVVPRH